MIVQLSRLKNLVTEMEECPGDETVLLSSYNDSMKYYVCYKIYARDTTMKLAYDEILKEKSK